MNAEEKIAQALTILSKATPNRMIMNGEAVVILTEEAYTLLVNTLGSFDKHQ